MINIEYDFFYLYLVDLIPLAKTFLFIPLVVLCATLLYALAYEGQWDGIVDAHE